MVYHVSLYLELSNSALNEIYATRICTFLSFTEFYYTIYVISKQYIKFANIDFFTISQKE